ncbi:MAG: hypothetical protein Q9159_004791 [Coniocarpon cinnabarinum]
MEQSFTAPPLPSQGPFSQAIQNPPHTFGNLGSDGSLLTPNLNFDFFSDNGFGFDIGQDDHGDNKRRRIAKACDACRRKKIKCDGQQPKCGHCQNYKTDCVFTHVEKKRSPPKSAKYIEGLENRLGRMENLLKMTGLLDEEDIREADLKALEAKLSQRTVSPNPSDKSPRSTSASNPTTKPTDTTLFGTNPMPSPESSQSPFDAKSEPKDGIIPDPNQEKVNDKDVEHLSDMMCSLVTNNCGDSKYIGSSSGLSILSPKGIQWVNEKTGDDSFQRMISYAAVNSNHWTHWRPDVFGDIFSKRGPTPLPPRHEVDSLIHDFFDSFNITFPLYHEPTFWWLLDRQYSADPYEGSGWWASLNVALAIAYRIRVIKNLSLGDDDAKAWTHFRNCLAVHSELTLRNSDLLSVQAMIAMSMFMQGTPNPQPGFSLIGAAIRLMHTMGLHKKSSGFGLNRTESEQRKRVFWIGYLLDKEMSIRSGRPPMQDDNDWNVELPDEEPEDGIGVVATDSGDKVNLFRKMCEFALISSRVYQRLYSVRAQKQSDGELLNTIGELDQELEAWKDSFPLDFRPEHEPTSRDQALMLQVVTVHFGYYNCLNTIHRMSVHHGYWTDRLSNFAIHGRNIKPLNPRVYMSAALVVQAARASINLIKFIPQGDYACVWLVLYYPVSALVTLFANILQNPQDPRARADLKLMSVVVNFLSRICMEEGTQSMKLTYTITKEFERLANVALNKAEQEMTSRQKRKQVQESSKVVDDTQSRQPDALRSERKRPIAGESAIGMAGSEKATDSSTPASIGGFMSSVSGEAGLPANGSLGNPSDPAFSDADSGTFADSQHQNDRQGNPLAENAPYGIDPTLLPDGNSSFQQPFVPQDFWSMPMTFEWDWSTLGQPENFNDHQSGGGFGDGGV